MFEQERRKADRLHLTPSIPGRMQEHEVRLVNIGVLGTTVEHDKPLIVGGPHKLRFKWDGEEIEVDCTVVHSEQKANIFKTGLSFVARPTALRRVLDTLNDRDEMDRLKTLVEASKLINSSIEPDALFGSILTVARNELHFAHDELGNPLPTQRAVALMDVHVVDHPLSGPDVDRHVSAVWRDRVGTPLVEQFRV